MMTALEAAHAALVDAGQDDHVDEIERLMEMFRPRNGDDPAVAQARKMMPCHCQNCELSWPALAMPAPMHDTALTGLRMAKCPRCFATEGVVLGRT